MATLEIDKKYIDESLQIAIDEIKQNFIPISVIEDIKAEIAEQFETEFLEESTIGMNFGLRLALEIIDNHIADMRGEK